MTLPVVAIVGRPNVGKSTLFNRMVGFRKAMVHDRPGVTRDRLYEEAEILDRRVLLVDTGGLEPDNESDLLASLRRQTLIAVEEAAVIIFLADAVAGLTTADIEVADLLRRTSKPVILAVNKVDGPKQEDMAGEFWSVGIGTLLTVSAAHGRGMFELMDAVQKALPEAAEGEDEPEPLEGIELDEDGEEPLDLGVEIAAGPIRIAVVGRPNIGKSTLINQLLGEDRHVVHDAPGTTMDPVDSAMKVGERDYVLVDTAGVRRKARIEDMLERWVSLRSIRAIERCHVVLLMIDAIEGPTDQDARLAQLVDDRGRAVVVLFNKWDLTKDEPEIDAKSSADALARQLPHLDWAPHLFVSAKTGRGVHRILATVDEVYEQFNSRVGTAKLNRFLEGALAAHSPPQRHHHPVRLYYVTQTRVRPPTFAFWCNTPEGIGPAYRKYLERRLREEFGLVGTPLRLHFKRRRKLGDGDEAE
jgi:GTP-binding protein